MISTLASKKTTPLVDPLPHSTVIGIDRKKVLQTATLRSVRAIRSVFCDAY
jgi:hypothetical protein